MDDLTEWMDEQPDRSPQPLPPPSFKELYEQLQSYLKPAIQAYIDTGKRITAAFEGQHIHSVILDETSQFKLGGQLDDPEFLRQLMEQKKRGNHGPRRGQHFGTDGKRKW